jgi:hypothetical protein
MKSDAEVSSVYATWLGVQGLRQAQHRYILGALPDLEGNGLLRWKGDNDSARGLALSRLSGFVLDMF